MLLWLQYLKQLEMACAGAAELTPDGAKRNVKTICEDEEWGNESEVMPGEPRTPSSAGERAASSGDVSPTSDTSAGGTSPPRLRLNTSLATDPALAPQATSLKHEPRSPSPPPPAPTPHTVAPPPTTRDFLALTAAAFPALFPGSTAPPSYICKPCGIRYSSLSTLQAHQVHYCSNRRPKPTETTTDGAVEAGVDESSGDSKSSRPAGKQYACSYCSYSADKKVSLNRHMRMHSTSPVSATSTPAPTPQSNGETTESSPTQDRYCSVCDIHFSSIRTYRAHKTHYCNTRQVVKPAITTARGGSTTSGSAPPSPGATPPATNQTHNQYALALPTNPILIVPYSIIRGASTLPGTTLPDPDTPCFLLPNGRLQPLSTALPSLNSEDKETEVLKSVNRTRDTSTPLDLSVRRSPESVIVDEHEKENRIRSTTPEQIVCAPSLPGSPVTPSPSRRSSSPGGESSPKRRRRDSRGPTPKPVAPSPPDEKFSPVITSPLLPPALALRLASELPVATASPQVLVKQGVSKCKECNIVFCKYENYRIHKRHYCSAGTGDDRVSPAPPEPGPPPQYRQLICMACGVYFSSLDNLATHQSFYCNKRETRSPRNATPDSQRPSSGSEGGWKCPCCDVVSPTAAAAHRHMESHAGVKAFRCTICQYRGNTLRGMRTHIRMHFPKKPADLQEESYIACVLEDEKRETTSPVPAPGDRVHRCNSCAYTSTYRGNVVRHAKLVHPTEDQEEDIPSPTPPPPPAEIKKEPGAELEETPNYCKSCNISFKYVNTYKAHKQFYCTANNQDVAANNNVPPPAARVTDATVL